MPKSPGESNLFNPLPAQQEVDRATRLQRLQQVEADIDRWSARAKGDPNRIAGPMQQNTQAMLAAAVAVSEANPLYTRRRQISKPKLSPEQVLPDIQGILQSVPGADFSPEDKVQQGKMELYAIKDKIQAAGLPEDEEEFLMAKSLTEISAKYGIPEAAVQLKSNKKPTRNLWSEMAINAPEERRNVFRQQINERAMNTAVDLAQDVPQESQPLDMTPGLRKALDAGVGAWFQREYGADATTDAPTNVVTTKEYDALKQKQGGK